MQFDNFLDFFTHHVEAIIQWLFLFILVLIGLLISRGLLGKKETQTSAALDTSGMDEVLQRILEQTKKLETMPLNQMAPADVAQVDQQVQALKKDLQAREAELAALKASGAPQTPTASADASALNTKIKELEAKLAEYEILEDDIADLSLYKEENSRLKGELDKLKGKGGAAADPNKENEIVSKFEEAVAQEPAPEGDSTLKVPNTGDPLKDFQSTVQMEREMQGKPPIAESAPNAAVTPAAEAADPAATEPTPAPTPTAPAPAPSAAPEFPIASAQAAAAPAASFPTNPTPQSAPAGEPAEAGDIFAEFSAAQPEENDGALDTDRMMAEMEQLVSITPATGNALEDGIDTEKMAAEASSLTKS